MTRIVNIVLLSVFCFQCFASTESKEYNIPSYVFNELQNKEYICYEFGISKIVKVIVAKSANNYQLFILDDKEQTAHVSILNESPIINWAFNIMPFEKSRFETVKKAAYDQFHFKLVYSNGNRIETVISSTIMPDNKELIDRLDELRKYIVKLWASEFMNI